MAGCSDSKTRARLLSKASQAEPATANPAKVAKPEPAKAAPPAAEGKTATEGAEAKPVLSGEVAGQTAELKKALAESSAVTYKVVVVTDSQGKDVNAYFDQLLAESGPVASDTLLLAVFPESGWDLRFAMGGLFSQKKVAVDEMLGLLRSLYFPAAREGDPASGLAKLVRAVNARMNP